jgi:hypothetical protein
MKADWATATIDRASAQANERSLWTGSGWARACLWLLLATGIVSRLSPLLDPGHRLYWQFMSEDGYLMQTVARNMALGLGMSTADGTMPTNGVQPLATFLYAALHGLAGGSKLLAIGYVTVLATVISAAAAWFSLAARPIGAARPPARRRHRRVRGRPVVRQPVRHRPQHERAGDRRVLPGDHGHARLLLLARPVARGAHERRPARRPRPACSASPSWSATMRSSSSARCWRRTCSWAARRPAAAGPGARATRWWRAALSMVVASPWLVFNKLNFGSVVPISGSAQSHSADFAANLRMIPANLIEASSLYARIPRSLETAWPW